MQPPPVAGDRADNGDGGFDRPIYTNVQMPFRPQPPNVPDANPTGVYRTTVTVPREWRGRRVVLHIGGAESVLFVWLNGRAVGMSKDSRLAAEFDVTEHVQFGRRNTLCAVVVRWSDASYVEDQDQWWHAGIHREVVLYSTASTYLADVEVVGGFASDLRTGTLDARIEVGWASPSERERQRAGVRSPSRRPEAGWQVEVQLETLGGRRLAGTPRRRAVDGGAVRVRGSRRARPSRPTRRGAMDARDASRCIERSSHCSIRRARCVKSRHAASGSVGSRWPARPSS